MIVSGVNVCHKCDDGHLGIASGKHKFTLSFFIGVVFNKNIGRLLVSLGHDRYTTYQEGCTEPQKRCAAVNDCILF